MYTRKAAGSSPGGFVLLWKKDVVYAFSRKAW